MTLIRIQILLTGLLLGLTSFSQTSELRSIDSSLTSTFKAMLAWNHNLNNDSLPFSFKKQLIVQLTNPITFLNVLDSLSTYLNIKSSADKRVKFYSWDETTQGTWHDIKCIAQFKSDNGEIVVQQLNTENTDTIDYTDSGVYEVNEIFINKKKYYLIFAWGTHGSGHEHKIAQVFSISSNKLEKCRYCFTNNNDLIIEYPRGEKVELTYNARSNIITYNEFNYDNNDGFYKPTGRIIALELINGVFTAR